MNKYLLLFLPLALLVSCGKGPETVTVNSDAAQLINTPDTMSTAFESNSDTDFVQVRIGEIAPIFSLDPLFAESGSELRVSNLLYDGLTQLSSSGKVIPALAREWEVNEDSTKFTFHLRTTVYFHDSPAFQNGNGRKMLAGDVKYSFDRMASNLVPDRAAKLFNDIRGFSILHSEQTNIKDPRKRAYQTIEGIRAINDSTLVFYMNQKAPDLLTRLAHPLASIYARESVPGNGQPIQQAAGTGPFQFIKKENNNYLFTSNPDYMGINRKVNRLDIVTHSSEKDLFQEFARNELDALIEVGPSALSTVTDTAGNLLTDIYPDYSLHNTGVLDTYALYYNTRSGQSKTVSNLINALQSDPSFAERLPGTVMITGPEVDETEPSDNSALTVTQDKHPVMRYQLDKIAERITGIKASLSMSASPAVTDQITFSTYPFAHTQKVYEWKYPVNILHHNRLSGIQLNYAPWNLDLNTITLEQED